MDTALRHILFLSFTVFRIQGDDTNLESSVLSNSLVIKDLEVSTNVPITSTNTTTPTPSTLILEPIIFPINLSTTTERYPIFLEPYEEMETTLVSPFLISTENKTNHELNSSVLLINDSQMDNKTDKLLIDAQSPNNHSTLEIEKSSVQTPMQDSKHVIKLENITDATSDIIAFNDSVEIDPDLAIILELWENTNATVLDNTTEIAINISEQLFKGLVNDVDNKNENSMESENGTIPALSERILNEIDNIKATSFPNEDFSNQPINKDLHMEKDIQGKEQNNNPNENDVLTFHSDFNNRTFIVDTEKHPKVASRTASDLFVAIRSAVTELSPRSLGIMTQQQSNDGKSSIQEQTCTGNCAQASSSSVNGKTVNIDSGGDERPKFTPALHHEERSWGKKRGPVLKCGRKGNKKSLGSVITHTFNLKKLQRSRQKRGISSATATATAFAGFPGWGPGGAFANAEGKSFSQNEGNSIANGQASAISGGPGLSIANGQGTAFSGGPGSGTAIGNGNAFSAGPGISIANGQGTTYSDGSGPGMAVGQGNAFSSGNGFSLAEGTGSTFGSGPGMNVANGQGSAFSDGPGLSMALGQGTSFTGENGFNIAEGKGTAFNAGHGLSIANGQGIASSGEPGSYGMPNNVPNSYDPYNLPNDATSGGVTNGYDPYSIPNDPNPGYNQYALPSGATSNGIPSGYDSYMPDSLSSSTPSNYNPYNLPNGPATNGMSTNPDSYNLPNNLATSSLPAAYDNYNYPVSPAVSSIPSGYENYAPQNNRYNNPYTYGIPNETPSYDSPSSYHSFGLRKREIPFVSEYNNPMQLSHKEIGKGNVHILSKRTIYEGGEYMRPNYLTYGMSNSASASSNSYGMANSNPYEVPDISALYSSLNDDVLEESEAANEMTSSEPYGISNKPSNADASSENSYGNAYNSYEATKTGTSNENAYGNSYKVPAIIDHNEAAAENSAEPSLYSYEIPSSSDIAGINSYHIPTSYEYANGNSDEKPKLDNAYGQSDDVQSNDNKYKIYSGPSYGQPISTPASNSYEVSEDTSTKTSYGAQSSGASSSNVYSSPVSPSYASSTVEDVPTTMSYGEPSAEVASPVSSYGMSNIDSVNINSHAVPSTDTNVKHVTSQGYNGAEAANAASNTDYYTIHDDHSKPTPVSYGMSASASSSANSYSQNKDDSTELKPSGNDYDYQSTSQSNGNIYHAPNTPNAYSSHDSKTVIKTTYTSPSTYGIPSENSEDVSSESIPKNTNIYVNPGSSYGAVSEANQKGSESYSQSNGQSTKKPSVEVYNTPQNAHAQDSTSNSDIYGVNSEDSKGAPDETISNGNRNGKTTHSQSSASASASASSVVNTYGGSGGGSYSTGDQSSSSAATSVSSNAADVMEYCWQAAIYINGKYKCGGSLIRRKWILTAAHCVEGVKASDLSVRLGESELNDAVGSTAQLIRVEVVKMHSHFNSIYGMYDHDVALLKLSSAALLSETVCLICLPGTSVEYFNNKKCTVTGYGSDSLGGQPLKHLKEITVPIVPSQNCEPILQKSIKDFHMHGSFMCAGGEHMKDTCSGDGGSPLVCEAGGDIYVQVGLVAWGVGCGQAGIPAVYSNIFYFDQWIHDSIQDSSSQGSTQY